jgi:type IV secretory pathway TrbL component
LSGAGFRSGGPSHTGNVNASPGVSPLRRAAAGLGGGVPPSAQFASTGGDAGSSAAAPEATPPWAQRIKRAQTIRHGASAATHAVRSGDQGGSGTSVNLSEGNA